MTADPILEYKGHWCRGAQKMRLEKCDYQNFLLVLNPHLKLIDFLGCYVANRKKNYSLENNVNFLE